MHVLNQPLFSFFLSSLLLVTVSTPSRAVQLFPHLSVTRDLSPMGNPSIRTADIPNYGSTTPRSAVTYRTMRPRLEYSGTLLYTIVLKILILAHRYMYKSNNLYITLDISVRTLQTIHQNKHLRNTREKFKFKFHEITV